MRRGEGARRKERKDEGEFVRVSGTRRVCLYGETVSGGEGRERVKLMYLFCGHPHMLLGERRLAALARRSLTARRMAEATWSGST